MLIRTHPLNLSPVRLHPAQLPVPSQVVAVAGPESHSHPLVVRSLAAHSARGEHLGVLVGHNRFDLYALAARVQEQGYDPHPVLARIELSRAFTCHQLHRRILTLNPERTTRWSALFVLGLLDTFYDEDVKLHEAQRLLRESLAHLKALAGSGLPVLITLSPPGEPGREHLLELAARQVDVYWQPDERSPRLVAPRQLALPVEHG
jgi:hypothetical protein